MKHFYFLLLLGSFLGHLNAQVADTAALPSFTDKPKWALLRWNTDPNYTPITEYRTYTQDTSICGKTYSLFHSDDILDYATVFIRADKDKAYLLPNDFSDCNNDEQVIFDYSLPVGSSYSVVYDDRTYDIIIKSVSQKPFFNKQRLVQTVEITTDGKKEVLDYNFVKGVGATLYHPFYFLKSKVFDIWHTMGCMYLDGTQIFGSNQCNSTIGTDDITATIPISIYPNPTQAIFYIKGQLNYPIDSKLYDIQGKMIAQQNIIDENTPFQGTTLEKGIYLLHITDQKGYTAQRKILIEN